MFRFAFSRLTCRARLTKNYIQRIGSKLSWSRSYAANEINYNDKLSQSPEVGCRFSRNSAEDIHFGSEENPFKNYEYEDICPGDSANPECNNIEISWSRFKAYKYMLIMSRVLYGDGFKALKAGVNANHLRSGILMAAEAVHNHLKHTARVISSSEEIIQIATTVGNRRIGELVVQAVEKFGKDILCLLSLHTDKKMSKELEFVNGMKLDWRYKRPFYINNMEEERCDLKNPLILIHENTILNKDVIEQAIRSTNYRRPLLIVAEDVDSKVASYIGRGQKSLGTEICLVVPREGQVNNREIMQDLAILTRGQVVSEVSDINSIPLMLGSSKEARISIWSTVILRGSGSQANIEERCEQLRSTIKMTTLSSEIKLLEERLVKLSRGLAIFKVGGATFAEYYKNERRASNPLIAVRSAIKEGFVPGGGVALLHASKVLDQLQVTNSAEKLGVQLVQHVLKAPVYSNALVAGFDGSIVVDKLLKQENPNIGYDPARGEYMDMIKTGNIDPCELVDDELMKLISFKSPGC